MDKKLFWMAGIVLLTTIYSCKEHTKGRFHISGTFKNATVTKVQLFSIPTSKDQAPSVLDSAKLSGSAGNFSLSGIGKEDIYELIFGDNVPVPIINDVEEIKVSVDLGLKEDYYEVTGSPASSQLKDMITTLGKKNFEVERKFAGLDSLKRQNAPDSAVLALTLSKNESIEDLNTYLKKAIDAGTNESLRVLALGWGSRSFSTADFENELDVLSKRYPANAGLQGMKKNYEAQKAQSAETANSWVGKQAPELELPDANGKMVSLLSSFKGKYVLVDFWASWCGPCRMENPNVVEAYNRFKDKNFAILGVSLDKEKEPWQKAVAEDKLAWTQVSDLKFWSSKAVEIFKFQGIPFNLLIDPQGKIVAQELRGPDLENKLKQYLQ